MTAIPSAEISQARTPVPSVAPGQAAGSPRVVAGSLAATGVVFVANGALLGAPLLLESRAYSEVATGTVHLAHYTVWVLCLLALTQLYPRLGALVGRTGRRLPGAVLVAAGVGAALDACARFVSAFVAPYLATREPTLMDSPPDAILLVPLVVTGVVAMAATATLAVTGIRRRVFPRVAGVLLLLGAIAIPVLGPVSNVLLGAALVWIGLSSIRSATPGRR